MALPGKAVILAATTKPVFTAPANKAYSVNINICNRSTSPVKVRLAIGSSSPLDAEFIEYDATIDPSGVLERTGRRVYPSEVVTVYADAAGLSVRVEGYEETV